MNNKEGKKPDPSGLRADGTKFRYTVVLRGIKFLNAVLITLPFAVAYKKDGVKHHFLDEY